MPFFIRISTETDPIKRRNVTAYYSLNTGEKSLVQQIGLIRKKLCRVCFGENPSGGMT